MAAGGSPVRVAVPPLQRSQLESAPGLLARRLPHDVRRQSRTVQADIAALQRRHLGAESDGAARRPDDVDVCRGFAATQRLPAISELAVLQAWRQRLIQEAIHVLARTSTGPAATHDHQQEATE